MGQRNVLLVDDDAQIREVVQLTLEVVGGWNVRLAASGAEAVAAVREEAPDVILLDLMMPGLDGPATLSRLQDAVPGHQIPVILLSAKVRERTQERQVDGQQVAGVIGKPFDPITLPDRISDILGWAAA
jgi:CheY-like chemotaxis protein